MNDEMEKAERLFQQLSGNETPKEDDLSHLKVCFQGSSEHGSKIIEKLLELDDRVMNPYHFKGFPGDGYYFVDIFTFEIDLEYGIPNGYKLLDIEDYLDEEEDMDTYYCPICEEEIGSDNKTMYYSDGDECCQLCYDESCDDLEDHDDEECDTVYTPQISELERAENTFRLLSETQSAPKDVINSKLFELSNIPRRKRR